MPAISTGKALMTGPNGFIGSWTLKAFLDAGFSVRASIRDKSKAPHLKKLYAAYGDKLELIVIPDIAKEGVFDEAVVGVDAIVHIASPSDHSADHPDEQIIPAVEGALGVLPSASKVDSIQRVLLISSCAAVIDPTATSPRVYDEMHWNEHSVDVVKREGRAAPQVAKYRASKTLAERAAWEFWRELKEKGAIGWDLTVLNPPWVFGPVIHKLEGGPEKLNSSNWILFDAIINGQISRFNHAFVDVRDMARAILLGITIPGAGGERLIVAAGPFLWEAFIIAAHNISGGKTHPPIDSYNPDATYLATMNVMKAKELLGMVYRSKEETTQDILKDYEERGWL